MKPVNFDYARPNGCRGVAVAARRGRAFRQGRRRQPVARAHAQHAPGPAGSSGRHHGHRGTSAGQRGCRRRRDRRLRHPRRYRGRSRAGCHRRRAAERRAGIAYRAVRNRGTIGGSLTHADPSADWISILAALGATVKLRGPNGVRTIPVEDYMLGALEADLRPRRAARLGEGASAQPLSPLGLSQGLPQDRRIRACDRRLRCRLPIAAFAARSSARPSSRPIVVADARAIIADGDPERFDGRAADALASSAGMNDPLDRQTHVVALRRAVERAARHEQGQPHGQRPRAQRRRRAAHASRRPFARDAQSHRHAYRLRARRLRRLHAARRRRAGTLVHHLRRRLRERRRSPPSKVSTRTRSRAS